MRRSKLRLVRIATVSILGGIPLVMGSSERDRGYHSDYFVFVSDDGKPPLVVPVDFNWEGGGQGPLFVELKAWWGSKERDPWPILYDTSTYEGRSAPQHWFRVPLREGFESTAEHRIALRFGQERLELKVPEFPLAGEILAVIQVPIHSLGETGQPCDDVLAQDPASEQRYEPYHGAHAERKDRPIDVELVVIKAVLFVPNSGAAEAVHRFGDRHEVLEELRKDQ